MEKEKDLIDLEFVLIQELQGRLNLLQPQEEREQFVEEALKKVLQSQEFSSFKQQLSDHKERVVFIKNFLSYGIITEILFDLYAEDIIINHLNILEHILYISNK